MRDLHKKGFLVLYDFTKKNRELAGEKPIIFGKRQNEQKYRKKFGESANRRKNNGKAEGKYLKAVQTLDINARYTKTIDRKASQRLLHRDYGKERRRGRVEERVRNETPSTKIIPLTNINQFHCMKAWTAQPDCAI